MSEGGASTLLRVAKTLKAYTNLLKGDYKVNMNDIVTFFKVLGYATALIKVLKERQETIESVLNIFAFHAGKAKELYNTTCIVTAAMNNLEGIVNVCWEKLKSSCEVLDTLTVVAKYLSKRKSEFLKKVATELLDLITCLKENRIKDAENCLKTLDILIKNNTNIENLSEADKVILNLLHEYVSAVKSKRLLFFTKYEAEIVRNLVNKTVEYIVSTYMKDLVRNIRTLADNIYSILVDVETFVETLGKLLEERVMKSKDVPMSIIYPIHYLVSLNYAIKLEIKTTDIMSKRKLENLYEKWKNYLTKMEQGNKLTLMLEINSTSLSIFCSLLENIREENLDIIVRFAIDVAENQRNILRETCEDTNKLYQEFRTAISDAFYRILPNIDLASVDKRIFETASSVYAYSHRHIRRALDTVLRHGKVVLVNKDDIVRLVGGYIKEIMEVRA